jgi:SPP1 gp7 family putative phage head morphogenesis protein
MPDVLTLALRFRSSILRREREAAVAISKAYGRAWKAIRDESQKITRQITEAQRAGKPIPASWLLQEQRLEKLQRQIKAELDNFAEFADRRIRKEQSLAVESARNESVELMEAALNKPPDIPISFTRLPKEAFQNMVGVLQNGSPLRSLLDELGPQVSAAISEALTTGIALGRSVRQIARQIRDAGGIGLTRALRISRTEVMRSYRNASHQSYKANSNVVKGWIWTSALGRRTCASCWANHGSFHTLDETLDDHPQGRCVPTPKTKTWAELGYPDIADTQMVIEDGATRFARLSADEQRQILGDAGYRAYSAGAVSLSDFAGTRTSAEWGSTSHRRSLREILGEQASQFYGE